MSDAQHQNFASDIGTLATIGFNPDLELPPDSHPGWMRLAADVIPPVATSIDEQIARENPGYLDQKDIEGE